HLAQGAWWADVLEVAADGLPDRRNERIDVPPALLRPWHGEAILLPVEVVQPQSSDFAGAQAVDGEEQEDRVIADVRRLVGRRTPYSRSASGRRPRTVRAAAHGVDRCSVQPPSRRGPSDTTRAVRHGARMRGRRSHGS